MVSLPTSFFASGSCSLWLVLPTPEGLFHISSRGAPVLLDIVLINIININTILDTNTPVLLSSFLLFLSLFPSNLLQSTACRLLGSNPLRNQPHPLATMSDPQQFEFFKYDPSLAANAVFVALFGLTAVGHTFLLVRNRTWYFIPFVLGCLCTFFIVLPLALLVRR